MRLPVLLLKFVDKGGSTDFQRSTGLPPGTSGWGGAVSPWKRIQGWRTWKDLKSDSGWRMEMSERTWCKDCKDELIKITLRKLLMTIQVCTRVLYHDRSMYFIAFWPLWDRVVWVCSLQQEYNRVGFQRRHQPSSLVQPAKRQMPAPKSSPLNCWAYSNRWLFSTEPSAITNQCLWQCLKMVAKWPIFLSCTTMLMHQGLECLCQPKRPL